MFLVWLKAAQKEDLFERHVFCLPEVYLCIYIYIFSFFAFVCLFVSSSFVFVSLCFFVCFLFMCLSIIISLGKKDAWAWICFYIIIIIYIYIYTNIYIYIYQPIFIHPPTWISWPMQIVSACLTRMSQEPCADWAMSSSSSEVVVSWLWHWWRRFLGQHCSIKHKAGRAIFNRIIWASHCEIWDVSGFGNRWQRTMCSHTVFLILHQVYISFYMSSCMVLTSTYQFCCTPESKSILLRVASLMLIQFALPLVCSSV